MSNFLELNKHELNNTHNVMNAVPRLFGTIMDCCFTNFLIAVAAIKGIEADEKSGTIEYGVNPTDDLEGQVSDAVSTIS